MINTLLDTALRMERFPGIAFVEGPAGRRAHVTGTGLDVWEIAALVKEYKNPQAVLAAHPGLTQSAVELALAYAQAYPDEIEEFLVWRVASPDQILHEFPHVSVARAQ